MSTGLARPQVTAWRNAVFVVFFACGFQFASYMARVPHVRDVLGASTAQMSVLAFAIAVGSISGMVGSSHVVAKLGVRRTILICAGFVTSGMVIAAIGAGLASFWLIAAGLAVFGFGYGTTDVGMNLSGAANERALGRTIMPIFHAMFSFGTMVGAALGALAEKLHVPVAAHLIVINLATFAAVALTNRFISENPAESDDDTEEVTFAERMAEWKRPLTLAIGVVVLGMALTEGSANDWLALAMVDGHHVSNATGAVALWLFLAAMTTCRLLGVKALDRFGRVPVLRACAVMAAVGLALVIFTPVLWLAYVGIVLWGLGAALGFPVGMSAAADDPRVAAARVSVVATVGYVAFLAGPPIIGFLGEHIGLLRALLIVLVAILAAGLAAGAVREPARQH